MFMGHLVSGPHDIAVYRGGSRGLVRRAADASPEDVERRPWLARWSHFIPRHDVEFADGTLGMGLAETS
jgi:hypothetical protein